MSSVVNDVVIKADRVINHGNDYYSEAKYNLWRKNNN